MSVSTVDSCFEQGVDFQERGLFDLAIKEYSKALEIEPDNPDVLINLGAAYLQKGVPEKSIQILTRALELHPENPLVMFNLGKAYLYIEKPEKALEVFEKAEKIIPDDPEVKKSIAQCLISLNRKEEAVEYFLAVKEHIKGDLPSLLLLGKTLMELHRFVESLEIFRKAVQAAPDSAEALNGLIRSQLELGLTDKAMTSLRRALMVYPYSPEFNLLMVDRLINGGEIDEAIATLKKAISGNPDNADLRQKLEEINRRLPILKKRAGKELVEKPSLYETETYDILDALFDGRISIDSAISALEELRKKAPDDLFIADELANLYFQSKRFSEATELYDLIQRSVPNDPRHRVNYAKCIALGGNPQLAQDFIAASMREFPTDPALPLAYVELKLLEKDFVTALQVIENTLNTFPDNEHAIFLKAYILFRIGNFDFAVETFKRLLRLASDDEEVVLWYSRLMIFIGRPQEALPIWDRFQDGLKSLLEILTRVELLLADGNWNSARELLFEIGKFEPRFLEDHLMFGRAFFYARDYHRCQDQMELVLRHDPKNPEALTFLALCYLMRSKSARFWMLWQKAIEADSFYPTLAALTLAKVLGFPQLEKLKNETRKILDITVKNEFDRNRLLFLLKRLSC